jgi:hypothetical protein
LDLQVHQDSRDFRVIEVQLALLEDLAFLVIRS